MALLSETPTAEIPRLVRDVLAANADIAAFCDRIAVADMPQFEQPLVTPSILVYPGAPQMARQIGGPIALMYDISVLLVLPRLTPCTPSSSLPTSPTATAGATGGLTGTYLYRFTDISDDGESYASDTGSVTVTNKAVSITIPTLTAGHGYRIWRSENGRQACRWIGTAYAAGTWTDDGTATVGDELAPVMFQMERATDKVVTVLLAGEWLMESGAYHADAAMAVRIGRDEVVQGRNVHIRELVATVPSFYDPATNAFLLGGTP